MIQFLYNADGIRTSKTVNNVEHVYTLNGTQIVSESWGSNLLIYLYDESGSPIGMQYRTTSYAAYTFDTFYFEKNLQGDIVAVYNANGVKVLSYTYDAWGNHTFTWVNRTPENMPAVYNPFRYRGYYYDTETQLYYLQSRYYNPAWGRFLNADGLISTGQGLLGYNMYAYCNNSPTMYVDPSGCSYTTYFSPFSKDEHLMPGVVSVGYSGTLFAMAPLTNEENRDICTSAVLLMFDSGCSTGMSNHILNFIYYEISHGQSNVTPYSYNDRYISRWERLAYAKSQTQEDHYNINAWRYYSEYTAHMFIWFAISWADNTNSIFGNFDSSAKEANVHTDEWDFRWKSFIPTIFFGFLGV